MNHHLARIRHVEIAAAAGRQAHVGDLRVYRSRDGILRVVRRVRG